MKPVKTIDVFYHEKSVGVLAEAADRRIAFSYDTDWLKKGFSISPLSLPLQDGVFLPKGTDPFDGLFGVFSDSLPDGWGRLLVDRILQRNGVSPHIAGPLYRLSILGGSGMGALTYVPSFPLDTAHDILSWDEMAHECSIILAAHESEQLDTLYTMGGSSGGARPKVYYEIDGSEWIVKFPTSYDHPDSGRMEYDYSLCARACGIDMPQTRLLPSDLCDGYFAVRRFDRENSKRIHMVSAAGLLETSHRIPNLDYHQLMQLTRFLTRDIRESWKLYRLMCFNVFAHNRDDHSKNFSYLCRDGIWSLSPAYDLTWSSSLGGEHATTVNGNGSRPGMTDLLAVAKRAGLDPGEAKQIAGEIEEIVHEQLGRWLRR